MSRVLSTQDLFAHPAHFFAFGFGTGLSRVAPGTVGSLLGIPFYLALAWLPLPIYILIVVALFLFGIWCCDISTRHLGVHDHGGIVWDEIVGMLIALLAVPTSLLHLALGFLLFRLFDILKPWPIGWVDKRVHGGFGIMMDDVIAGAMACVCMQLIIFFFVPFLISFFA